MPERKPFEDAWLLLDAHATANEVEAKNYRRKGRDEDADDLEREARSYRAAIAFLEAGQKVDRRDVIDLFNEIMGAEGDARGWRAVYTNESARPFYDMRRQLHALLSALPKGD